MKTQCLVEGANAGGYLRRQRMRSMIAAVKMVWYCPLSIGYLDLVWDVQKFFVVIYGALTLDVRDSNEELVKQKRELRNKFGTLHKTFCTMQKKPTSFEIRSDLRVGHASP